MSTAKARTKTPMNRRLNQRQRQLEMRRARAVRKWAGSRYCGHTFSRVHRPGFIASGKTDRPPHPAMSAAARTGPDRKSTRLNSSHVAISYAVFCLKKKKHNKKRDT